MRRSDHPSCPSAITCCFLSSLKTLLTLTQGNSRVRINVLDQTFVGRFSGDNHWPHLSDYRGCGARWQTSILHCEGRLEPVEFLFTTTIGTPLEVPRSTSHGSHTTRGARSTSQSYSGNTRLGT